MLDVVAENCMNVRIKLQRGQSHRYPGSMTQSAINLDFATARLDYRLADGEAVLRIRGTVTGLRDKTD